MHSGRCMMYFYVVFILYNIRHCLSDISVEQIAALA